MKIALVDNSRGWGGTEQILFSLASGLRNRGHYVGLFLREGSETIDKFVNAGFDTWAIPRKGLGKIQGVVKMTKIAWSRKFDLVHVHRNHDLLVGKIVSYFSGKLPLVLTQHCQLGKTSLFAINLPDRIVTVSKFIADGIIERFPKLNRKIRVVHNGINLSDFQQPMYNYWAGIPELDGKGPLLGVVGYFYKNQEELIELLPRIRDFYPNVMLIIIGLDDSKMKSLKKKVSDCGVADSVFFAGDIDYKEMQHALAGLELNISAYRKEGFGLSVIEGMAVGTPFVGFRAGGYEEIVLSGRCGYLVENADDFVANVLRLLNNKDLLNKMSHCARHLARERFPSEMMISKYEEIYLASIKQKTGCYV